MTDFVQDPRAALDRLLADKGIDYARLSQVIGRNPAYIQQYIKRGSPRRLAEQDRARIAAFLGVSEAMLGGPVQRIARAPGQGRISVISDNPHYRSWDDLPMAAVQLVGRVVWTGRRVR